MLTVKQEKFVQKYIELGNASQAYRETYDVLGMSTMSINKEASKLLNHPQITPMINSLREEHQVRHAITVNDLLLELEEARFLAKEKKSASAMIQATMGKARLTGLDKQVFEHTQASIVFIVPKQFDTVEEWENYV